MEVIQAPHRQKIQKTTPPEPRSSLTEELILDPRNAEIAMISAVMTFPQKLPEVFNFGNELLRTAIKHDLPLDKNSRQIDVIRISSKKEIDEDLAQIEKSKWSSFPANHIDKLGVPTGIIAEFASAIYHNPEIGDALHELMQSLIHKRTDNRFDSKKYISDALQFLSDPNNSKKTFHWNIKRKKMDVLVDQLKPIGKNPLVTYVLSSLHSLISYKEAQTRRNDQIQKDYIASQNTAYETQRRYERSFSNSRALDKKYERLKKKHPNSKETKETESNLKKASADYVTALQNKNNADNEELNKGPRSGESEILNSVLTAGVIDQMVTYDKIFHNLSELLRKIRTDDFQNGATIVEEINNLRKAPLPERTKIERQINLPPKINKAENRYMHWLHGGKDRGLALLGFSLLILTGLSAGIESIEIDGFVSEVLAAPLDKKPTEIATVTMNELVIPNKAETPTPTPTPDAKSDFDRLVLPENKGTFIEQSKNAQWSMFSGHSIFIPENGPTMKPDQIDYVLDTYNKSVGREDSPAAGLGLGQFIYERCIFYNIDPAIILGIFNKESGFGTMGMATLTDNIGNVRSLDMNGNKITDLITDEMNKKFGFGIQFENNNGYADYFAETHDKKTAYMMSVEHELRTLYEFYINNTDGSGNPMPRTTIETVIEKFAPRSENDTDKYIKDLINFTNMFRFTYGEYSRVDVSNVEPSGNPLGAQFEITQGFNGTKSHIQKDTEGRQVGGVDLIRSDNNTYRAPIYSTSGGVFHKIKNPTTTYGNLAIIEYFNPHSEVTSDILYGHMDSYNTDLKEGQWIPKGTLLGYIGFTGWVDPPNINGSHLHYSRYNTDVDGNISAIDPEPSLYKDH